jgi:hypothetical protein
MDSSPPTGLDIWVRREKPQDHNDLSRKTEIMPTLLTNMPRLSASLLLAALPGIPAVRAERAAAAPVATPSSFPVRAAARPMAETTAITEPDITFQFTEERQA